MPRRVRRLLGWTLPRLPAQVENACFLLAPHSHHARLLALGHACEKRKTVFLAGHTNTHIFFVDSHLTTQVESVFLTGGTGFLGAFILVELLRRFQLRWCDASSEPNPIRTATSALRPTYATTSFGVTRTRLGSSRWRVISEKSEHPRCLWWWWRRLRLLLL